MSWINGLAIKHISETKSLLIRLEFAVVFYNQMISFLALYQMQAVYALS